MALSYKNDDQADDRLNPATQQARALNDLENQSAQNQNEQSLASQNDTSGNTANLDNLRNKEKSPGFINNFTGNQTALPKGQKVNFLKKRGPLAAILAILLGGGGGLMILFSPSLMLVQLKEALVGDLNDQLAASSIGTDHVLRSRVKGMQKNFSLCTGIKIRCNFATMSNHQIDKFKKAGFEIDSEKTKFGRNKVTKIVYKKTTFTDPNQFYRGVLNDLDLRKSARLAFNPKFAGTSDRIAKSFYLRFRTTKANRPLGKTDDERNRNLDQMTAGEKANPDPPRVKQDENDPDKTYIENPDGSRTYSDDPDYQKKLDTLDNVNKELTTTLDTGVKSTTRILGAGVKGLSITGSADTACTVYNTARAVNATAKAVRAMQMAQFAMLFLNMADQIKSGVADPGEVEYLGKKLAATDNNKYVDDESAIEGVELDANGNVVDVKTKNQVENPFYGSNAMDSPGYKVAAYNEAPKLTSRSQQYMVGGVLSGSFASVLESVTKVLNKLPGSDINSKCGKIQNPLVRTAGLVVGLVAGFGSGFTTIGISIGASIAIGFAQPFLEAQLADMLAGQTVNSHTAGVDAGDAMFSGSSTILGGTAMARGLKPLNKSGVQEYMALSETVKNDYIAMEREDAKKTPFDIYNQYSFLGSLVRTINPVVTSSDNSLAAIITGVPKLFGATVDSFSGRAFAANPYNPERFSLCNDPGYEKLGIDADVFCNVRYGLSKAELSMDPLDVVSWMYDGQHCTTPDGDPAPCITGDGEPMYQYKEWIPVCTERTTGWGENTSENGGDGSECMPDSEQNKNFRMYTLYKSLNDAMDEDLISASGGTAASGSALVGNVAWPIDSSYWDKYPDMFLSAHGTGSGVFHGDQPHAAVDLNVPGSDDCGLPVYSMFDGQVTKSPIGGSGGNGVEVTSTINGKKLIVTYAHGTNNTSKTNVKAGEQIMKIGSTGNSSGCHLHMDMALDGRSICPQDIFLAMGRGEEPDLVNLVGKANATCSGREK